MGDTNERHDHREQPVEPTESSSLSDDDLYRAFASTERRRALYLVHETGEQTVRHLATQLAGWEASASGRMRDADDHTRLAIELTHAHLPLLDDVGLLTFDHAADSVRPVELDSDVVSLLERSIEAERARPE